MKQIHVIRHTKKDATGKLTEEGKQQASNLREKLTKYYKVISSDIPRAQETAYLLTGEMPLIDARASIPDFTKEQERELFELGQTHPHGIAGVIFDTPEYIELVKTKGEILVALIKETIINMPENEKVLIITHDGPMIAAEKIFKNESFDKARKNYKPLHGFKVNEHFELEDFKLE